MKAPLAVLVAGAILAVSYGVDIRKRNLCRELDYPLAQCDAKIEKLLANIPGVKQCFTAERIFLATTCNSQEEQASISDQPKETTTTTLPSRTSSSQSGQTVTVSPGVSDPEQEEQEEEEGYVQQDQRDAATKALEFALTLFKNADPNSSTSNYILSPLSVQMLLSNLIAGGSDSTRAALLNTLRLSDHDLDELGDALEATALESFGNMNKLDIASQIFLSNQVTLTTKFRDTLKSRKIPLEQLDFSNPRTAAQTINDWVSVATRSNIPKIVTEQSLESDTLMLLLNAIYFKGTWMYKFNSTKRSSFQQNDHDNLSCMMMSQKNKLRHGEISQDKYREPTNGLRWIELPYVGDQLAMIVMLPKRRFQLDQQLSLLTVDKLKGMFQVLKSDYNPINFNVEMPKFLIDNTVSLVEPLKKMGLSAIFEDNPKPFPRLSKTPAKVGDVQQQSFLSVDEKGTTATAVTKVTLIPLSLNPFEDQNFICNEPFLVMVVDKSKSVPLFMAKIKQPSKPPKNKRL